MSERPPEAAVELETDFAADVASGLAARPKRLPSKYFYDRRGTALFAEITRLPEYYLTRAEREILERHGREIGGAAGPACLVVEVGGGSGDKTRLLLEALEAPAGYAPVDLSRAALDASARDVGARLPSLEVLPIEADISAGFELPPTRVRPRRVLTFFPGSTIGNFEPEEAGALLGRLATSAAVAAPSPRLLVGFDLRKPAAELERAYDDAAGVTARFNLNLLARINRELGADLDPGGFAHEARYDEREGRIEMYLRSRAEQRARIGERRVRFAAGERILTELSYKYDPARIAGVARLAGLEVERLWTDRRERFAVALLAPDRRPGVAGV